MPDAAFDGDNHVIVIENAWQIREILMVSFVIAGDKYIINMNEWVSWGFWKFCSSKNKERSNSSTILNNFHFIIFPFSFNNVRNVLFLLWIHIVLYYFRISRITMQILCLSIEQWTNRYTFVRILTYLVGYEVQI